MGGRSPGRDADRPCWLLRLGTKTSTTRRHRGRLRYHSRQSARYLPPPLRPKHRLVFAFLPIVNASPVDLGSAVSGTGTSSDFRLEGIIRGRRSFDFKLSLAPGSTQNRPAEIWIGFAAYRLNLYHAVISLAGDALQWPSAALVFRRDRRCRKLLESLPKTFRCPAIPRSQQIANLEFELDAKLLLRSAQGIMPTAAVSALDPHARQILRQMDWIPRGRTGGRPQRSGPGGSRPFDNDCRHAGPPVIRARPQVVSGHSIADRRWLERSYRRNAVSRTL